MPLTPMHFLIVCPLVFAAGFVDSIAGGGGLISLPAYLISGLPVHASIATNKLSSSMGTCISTARYAKNGYINWKLSVFCIVSALVGASLGANLALLLDDVLFRFLMLIILPVTAVYVMRKKDLFSSESRTDLPFCHLVVLASFIAFGIGMYDGFYGPGTGTFLILLLTRFAHMDLTQANGLSKAINLTSNLTSLTVYLLNGQVIMLLGLIAGAFSILGNYLGSRSFARRGASIARPIILLVLILLFIRTILEFAGIL